MQRKSTEARLVAMLCAALQQALRPGLLSRPEDLGLKSQSFRRHVRPVVPAVIVGDRVLFDRRDLDAWAESKKRVGAIGPRRPGKRTAPKAA